MLCWLVFRCLISVLSMFVYERRMSRSKQWTAEKKLELFRYVGLLCCKLNTRRRHHVTATTHILNDTMERLPEIKGKQITEFNFGPQSRPRHARTILGAIIKTSSDYQRPLSWPPQSINEGRSCIFGVSASFCFYYTRPLNSLSRDKFLFFFLRFLVRLRLSEKDWNFQLSFRNNRNRSIL